jgi:hypothetical protein
MRSCGLVIDGERDLLRTVCVMLALAAMNVVATALGTVQVSHRGKARLR